MSDETGRTTGQIILGWWSQQIGDRSSAAARGLAARLRRGTGIEVLAEPQVQLLARDLGLRDAGRILRLVTVLAEVRQHVPQTLARRLGGDHPALSTLRLRRLLRAEGEDLTTALRRALPMAERRCNVAALGTDLLFWNDDTRARWAFHYFGAAAPESLQETAT